MVATVRGLARHQAFRDGLEDVLAGFGLEMAVRLAPGTVIFDTVYTPACTPLLAAAESAGATVVSGVELYRRQAAMQFKLWTGEELPQACLDLVHHGGTETRRQDGGG